MRELQGQQGMSLVGILLTAAFLGTLAIAGLRVLPLYLTDLTVGSIFRSLEKDAHADMSRAEIVEFIQKRMEINGIDEKIELHGLRVEPLKDQGKRVVFEYEARAPLLGNLDAVARFRHEAILH